MRALRLSTAVSWGALLAGLATPGAASAAAACGNYVLGQHYFAGTGTNDVCIAPGGAYAPTPTTGILPFTDTGYGLLAFGNGQLSSSGLVTVNESNANSAAVGAGEFGVLTLTNGATLNVSGANSSGVETLNGGQITIGATGVVTTISNTSTTGLNGADISTTTSGASVTANNVQSSFAFSGGGIGVFASGGATLNLNGGSVSSTGAFVVNAAAWNSAALNLNGTSLTASGNGGDTLWASNGGTVTGVNLTINSTGGPYQASTGTILAGGASNNAYGSTVTGGVLKLTTSSITATGYGVYTANGGVTTLTGDTISTSGANGFGVQSAAGSQTTIYGGSFATSGASTLALYATGAGATITTQLYNNAGVVVTTSGPNAYGVQADTGGVVTLNGGSVTTSGAASIGLFATGLNSQISATDVAVASNGTGGVAAAGATVGGSLTMIGGSANASGPDAYGVFAASGGSVQLNGSSITTSGAGAGGVAVNGAASSLTASNLTIIGNGTFDSTNNFYADGVTNQAYQSDPKGGTVKLTNSTITMTQASGIGVFTDQSGVTNITGGAVSTQGDYGSAVYNGNGGGDTGGTSGAGTVTLSNVQVSTTGLQAPGVSTLNGGATSVTGGTIVTSGVISDAFYESSAGSSTLSSVAITTTGNGAKGISIHGTASSLTGSDLTISTSGGVDSTTGYVPSAVYNGSGPSLNSGNTGGGALKLTNTTIVTSGDYGYGVYTADGGTTTLTGGSIKTSGFKSDAVFGFGASTVALSGLTIATTGDSAKGLNVEGTGTTLTGSNLTISTAGIVDPATGYGVEGVYNGSGKNPNALTVGGGTVTLTDTNVSTTGAGAPAVQTADNGVTYFYGGSISTGGGAAVALLGQSGASVTVGLDALAVATQISTSGLSSGAVAANTGATISLTGANVSTTGAGSTGLIVNDAGSSLTATNVTVTTSGGVDTNTGFHAHAIYNGPGTGTSGGSLTLNNVTASTTGDGSSALFTETGGTTTVTGGSFSAASDDVNVVYTFGSGALNIDGATVTASGVGSTALALEGAGGSVKGTNLTLVASGDVFSGDGSHAEGAFNGPFAGRSGGGTMTLSDTSIRTSGYQGYGLSTGAGSTTSFLGGSIATTGVQAFGVLTINGGATSIGLDAAGKATTITTTGASALGAGAFSGGSLTLDGTLISTVADGATGLVDGDAGTTVTATNVTISTKGGIDTSTGNHADGVYNGPGTRTSGGNLTLTNATVSTAGFESSAMVTSTGGSSTVTGGTFSTSGENAAAMIVLDAGRLQISGATLLTSGLGSPGLVINGSGGVITASNLTIVTTGQISTTTGSYADGIYNGTFGFVPGGGTMNVTDSTVRTSGDDASGVAVGAGGTTTFLGGAVTTHGGQANAALATNGGSLTIGLDAAGKATTLTTTGNGSYAVESSNGAHITLDGAQVVTSGDGSGGIRALGADSQIDATNVTIATTGGYDSASDQFSYGVHNAPHGSYASGGVVNLTDSTITTQGVAMYGVYTGAGSTTAISGGSVSTSGAGAHALVATGSGANVTANGVALSTSGTAAFGAYVAGGASLTLGGGTSIATSGVGSTGLEVTGAGSIATVASSVSIATGADALGLSADNGGTIVVKGALTLNAAGTALTIQGGPSSGSISFGGPLTINDTSTTAPAILLSGDNATFNGAGGGTIHSAGQAVALLNGVGQSATFVNYTIDNVSGDLFFADPTTATLNFDNTTLNAGSGNIVDATAGSAITVNANHSSLTGAVATDATSTTSFNLTNASTLTLTGDSTITDLNLANSTLKFSAPGGGAFKTLTVTNFVGTNGLVTLNASLGPNGAADRIVVNGGAATGSTTLSIHPVGAAGATSGLGVPVVTTTNGGTIAPGAFSLAAPLVVNGYLYTLETQGSGDYLVSNTTQTPQQATASLAALSQSRQTQTITAKVLGSILTGATEQINCSSCQSGFASFGSLALGVHGRWTLSPSLALLAGGSYDSFSGRGVTVNNSMQAAIALRYDAVSLGKNRPFVEGGVTLQPWASVTYSRSYASALGGGVGTGTALSQSVALYGRVGYIWRLSRIDEAAVYTDVTRSWDHTSGYTESGGAANPNAATISPELDTLNVWRSGAQFTHLFGEHIEGNISGGFAEAFGAAYGTSAAIGGFGVDTGSAPTSFHWWEVGGRVSYRFSKTVTADLFVLGTLGAQPVGDQIHGGAALRMAF